MPKAYVFTAHGGPEVEAFVDLPRPSPGPGQLLVAVQAAGVNPADWKRRAGFRRPGVPAPDAATLPIAAATAYDGINQLGLAPGTTLLITGVGGGVGVAAAQLALQAGLRVIGTASRGKKDFVEALGVIYVEPGFGVTGRIRLAAPGGVDAIYGLVGADALEEVASVLSDRSKLIIAADRETAATLGGVPVARARNRAVLDELAKRVAAGTLRPLVTATYPLDRAPEALRLVEQGHARGKIVIEVASRIRDA
jgi:NADPH:quinone reductase-like Zn-dependent oxidoreductase